MIWLLFIPTFTWILFKVGLNACWGFLFAVIIWISVEMEIPFWIWLFIEVIMSLIYFYQLISITEVKPNKCSNCPNCKSDCSTSLLEYYIFANSLFSHWKRFSNQIFIDCTSFSYAPQIVLLGQV